MLNAPPALVAALDSRAARGTTSFAEGRMVWRRWGQGPPLVLLHGASGSWTHWLRNIDALAERFTVLVPDMPGFGDSDDVPEPHTAERLADRVATGVDAMVPSPATFDLAGFSFGGIVAGLVAARLGARVGRLVLIGPGGMASRSDVGTLTLARLERGMSEAQAREVHRANLRVLMLGDPAAADDLAVQLQIDNVSRARFKSGTIPFSDVLLRAWPAVTARVTAIYGSRDAFAVPYVQERRATLAQHHPELDFRVIEGAGHWVPYEAPEAVNRALLEAPPRDARA